jgi:hypothetical protein
MPSDSNPYAAPPPLPAADVDPAAKQRKRIANRLGPPSMGLMVLSGMMCPYVLAIFAIPIFAYLAIADWLVHYPGAAPPAESQLRLLAVTLYALVGIQQALIFRGTLHLRYLGSYRWACLATWLALIPQPMWPIQAPFAIWALLWLRRKDARAAFKVSQ